MDSTIVPHDTFCNVIEEAVSAVEGRQTQPRPAAPVPSPPSHTSGPRASRGLVKQIVDNAFKQGGTVFLDPYGGRGEPALQAVACHPKITKATSIEVVDARHAEAEAVKTEVVERLRQAGYDAAAQRVQDRVVNVLGDCREQDAGFDAATIIFLNNRHAKTCRGLPRFASAMSLEQDVAEIIVSANSKPHMRPQRRLIYALDPIPVLTDLGCDEQPPWMSDDAPLDTQHPALRIYRYTVPATPDPRQDAAAAPRRSSRQREPPRATRPPVPRPRPLVVVKLTPDWQTYIDNGCGRYVASVDGPLRGNPVKVTYALSDAPPEDVERTAVAPLLALGSDDHISLDRLVLEEYLAMATAIPKKDYRHEAVECLVKSLQEFHADWRAWLRSTRLDRVNDFQERVSYCCPSMELLKSLEKESRGLDVGHPRPVEGPVAVATEAAAGSTDPLGRPQRGSAMAPRGRGRGRRSNGAVPPVNWLACLRGRVNSLLVSTRWGGDGGREGANLRAALRPSSSACGSPPRRTPDSRAARRCGGAGCTWPCARRGTARPS